MPLPEAEVDLHGLKVEEARLQLDRYLNDAFLSGLQFVRVIHGKGTGALRQAVGDQLANHPLVKSFRPAEFDEGGGGVTIVEMVSRYLC